MQPQHFLSFSNVNTNGDLSGLVNDCREWLLRPPQVKL